MVQRKSGIDRQVAASYGRSLFLENCEFLCCGCRVAGATKLRVLRSTHPRLDLFYLQVLRALYKGGKDLLQNSKVMAWVFPRTAIEGEKSYEERKARAFYDPDFALCINTILAGLAQDPLIFDDGSGPTGTGKTEVKLDEYWTSLMVDCTAPNVPSKKSWDEVMREVTGEGLVCGWGWSLCEMPKADPEINDLAGQVNAGKLRAYVVPYRADQVLNWSQKDGQFLWVRTYSTEMPADNPEDERVWTVHTWRVWDANEITVYQLSLDSEGKDERGHLWTEDDFVPPVEEPTPHSFGQVPWRLLDLCSDGEPNLHVGGLIESRARALFNEGCGESFLRTRAMFQQLYEFLGPDMPGPDSPIATVQENPNRASRTMGTRAPDIVQLRGREDDAKYVAPDMSVAAINRQALADGREAIPRITGQLALSADTSGAMLRRSGDSKRQDKVAQKVLNGAVGDRVRSYARAVAELLAIGRGDDPKSAPQLKGYANLDSEDASERVEQHVALGTAPIQSAAFQVEEQLRCAQSILGDCPPDLLKLIREQLESTITQDSLNQANMPPVPPGHQLDDSGKPIPLPMQKEEKIPFKSKKN